MPLPKPHHQQPELRQQHDVSVTEALTQDMRPPWRCELLVFGRWRLKSRSARNHRRKRIYQGPRSGIERRCFGAWRVFPPDAVGFYSIQADDLRAHSCCVACPPVLTTVLLEANVLAAMYAAKPELVFLQNCLSRLPARLS